MSKSNKEDNSKKTTTRFIPVPDWNKYHPWPKEGGLRNLIYKRDENGFNKVVIKLGKRVLIDEAAFFEWVKSKNEFGME